MPLLLLVVYPVIEILIYFKFVERYGIWDAFLITVSFGMLGILVMLTQGRAALQSAQGSLMQGKLPSDRVFHQALMMFAGFLFFLPGLLNDAVAMLLILPGFRHLIVFVLKVKIGKSLAKGGGGFGRGFGFPGGFATYTFGRGAGLGGFTRGPQGFGSEPHIEKDATVIDVESISLESPKPGKKS